MSISPTFNQLVSDPRQVLRESQKIDSNAGVEFAAEQFEALFIQMIFEQMHQGTQAIAAESSLLNDNGYQMFQQMHDAQVSAHLAGESGLGLAKHIVAQLTPASLNTGSLSATATNADAHDISETLEADFSINLGSLSEQQAYASQALFSGVEIELEKKSENKLQFSADTAALLAIEPDTHAVSPVSLGAFNQPLWQAPSTE